MNKKILFICTGNYYRSRFAQAVFNHRARLDNLPWEAYSRGLRIDAVMGMGELSVNAVNALEQRKIDLALAGDARVALTKTDFETADRTVALKRSEHYPMMQRQFPDWIDRIDYWDVHDTDLAQPEISLPLIEEQIVELMGELANPQAAAV